MRGTFLSTSITALIHTSIKIFYKIVQTDFLSKNVKLFCLTLQKLDAIWKNCFFYNRNSLV